MHAVCKGSLGVESLASIDGGGETRVWRKKLWQIFSEFLGEALGMLCIGALTSLLFITGQTSGGALVWFW
jgi:hypothetical protein